jgi:hypothetical protein
MESQVTNAAQVICPVCETELLADAVFCDEMRSPAEESGDLPRLPVRGTARRQIVRSMRHALELAADASRRFSGQIGNAPSPPA